ncbi:hypothetical protein BGP34_22350 [Bacillus mycoides]|uniref:caspase family protein n=1 Tax=Bacillus mycoides TaxID=1405 RepID=UPI0009935F7A|nr:caspase family protein [Bacillus mycoides]OOR55597.1 hypothetical protein BGP34_22350 [Bacillus mycoides]
MGIKLAILIGVSKYNNIKSLDACLRDVEIMHELIRQTNCYDDILYIKDNTDSRQVKEKIVAFVKQHQDNKEDIDQVFFYFSGHGDVNSSDVYYLLSDYDRSKLKGTSLENTEVDSYLRLLKPKLAVKVIDACYSGIPYIKSGEEILENTVKSSARGQEIKDCYFMFSSQNTEESHAQALSYFTESFIEAIREQPDNTVIRFKDITDRISDTFNGIYKGEQTPQFINQANLTEEFCLVTSELKEQLTNKLEGTGAVVIKSNEDSGEIPTLLDYIKEESKEYCNDFSEVLTAFNTIKQTIDEFALSGIIENLYDLKISTGHINDLRPMNTLDKFDSVANLLEKKQNDYFFKVIYEEEENKNSLFASSLYSLMAKRKPIDLEVGSGEAPFDYIFIKFEAKYPVLKSYKCSILIFLSRLNLLIMNSLAPYKEISWDQYSTEEKQSKWKYRETRVKHTENLKTGVQNILKQCAEYISNEIHQKYEAKNMISKEDITSILPTAPVHK